MEDLPLPDFINTVCTAIIVLIQVLYEHAENESLILQLPVEHIMIGIISLLNVFSTQSHISIHAIIRTLYPTIRGQRQEVWPSLAEDSNQFWRLTGETPNSLASIINRVAHDVAMYVRNPRQPRQRIRKTRPPVLSLRDRVLMLFVWLRSYLTFSSLGIMFGVSESTVAVTIHTVLFIVLSHYERLYVRWNSHHSWNRLRNILPDFPNVVGVIDATPIWINRPQGNLQRMYYRRDRGFHFINWQVIIDCAGVFRYGQSGFMGHLTDAASFHMLPQIGYNCPLHLPRNSYIMADSGYPMGYPLLVPFSRRGGRRLNAAMQRYNHLLYSYRVRVEHRIHDLKIYRCISSRFRHRRYRVCAVANLVMALTNRRGRVINRLRNN